VPDVEVRGASTGWEAVDEHYRVVPGELTVVTGIPGSGKSEWLLSLLCNLAEKRDWKFATCTFESSLEDFYMQLLEKRHRANFRDLQHVDLDWDWLEQHFTSIGSTFQELDVDTLLEAAQYVASTKGLDGLLIDPYNYIERLSMESETDFVSTMLTKLKHFAQRNMCHVWLVAHPVKMSHWRASVPTLYDVSGSAHFYNKCDMGLIVHRNRDLDMGGLNLMQLHVQKVRKREAGSPGVATLCFNKEKRRYSDSRGLGQDEDEDM